MPDRVIMVRESEWREMREALEFYRDGFRHNPRRTRHGIDVSTWTPRPQLLEDCGEKARAAIARVEEAHPTPDGCGREGMPRVKDLGWPGAVQQGRRARSFGGLLNYTIAYYGGSEPDSGVVFRWAREGGTWSEAFFSYEGAITAAQADYERRILSALEGGDLVQAAGTASRGPCIPVMYCALATSTHVPLGSDDEHCDLCGHVAQPNLAAGGDDG